MDMRFGTWNVRSMYWAGSLRAVAEEISKYKLDLVGVQEVRWGGEGTESAGEYTFYCGKENENHELGTDFFIQKKIVSAVRSVEFISDMISYIIVLLNVHRVSDVRQIEMHTAEPLAPDPSPFVNKIAIANLKRYTSPGSDQIPAELVQTRGEILYSKIHKLINSIWNEEELSDQWKESIIVPVHKKGNKND
jgi:hypothetical protein